MQQYFAEGNWLERSGSPETFAPLLRLRPTAETAGKTVAFQTAFGDATVPNFTAGNIYRAGQLFDRVTYYRNDKTLSSGSDPHGFLANPTLQGPEMAELQLTTFLKNPSAALLDPDGPLPIFEVPIADQNNLQCLHYPDPQTGSGAYPPPAAGECAAAPAEPRGRPAAAALTGSGSSADSSGSTANSRGTSGSLAATGGGVGLPLAATLLLALAAVPVLRRRRRPTR